MDGKGQALGEVPYTYMNDTPFLFFSFLFFSITSIFRIHFKSHHVLPYSIQKNHSKMTQREPLLSLSLSLSFSLSLFLSFSLSLFHSLLSIQSNQLKKSLKTKKPSLPLFPPGIRRTNMAFGKEVTYLTTHSLTHAIHPSIQP